MDLPTGQKQIWLQFAIVTLESTHTLVKIYWETQWRSTIFSVKLIENLTGLLVSQHKTYISDIAKRHDPCTHHGQRGWICKSLKKKSFWIIQKDTQQSVTSWWDISKFRIKEIIEEFGKEKAWVKKQKYVCSQKCCNSLVATHSVNEIKKKCFQVKF